MKFAQFEWRRRSKICMYLIWETPCRLVPIRIDILNRVLSRNAFGEQHSLQLQLFYKLILDYTCPFLPILTWKGIYFIGTCNKDMEISRHFLVPQRNPDMTVRNPVFHSSSPSLCSHLHRSVACHHLHHRARDTSERQMAGVLGFVVSPEIMWLQLQMAFWSKLSNIRLTGFIRSRKVYYEIKA